MDPPPVQNVNMADLNADVEQKTGYKIDSDVRKVSIFSKADFSSIDMCIMKKSLESYRCFHKRIYADAAQSSEDFYGILIGDANEELCDIVGCIRCTYYESTEKGSIIDSRPDWVKEIAEICTLIPTGKVGAEV
jgi:hypothetical protein